MKEIKIQAVREGRTLSEIEEELFWHYLGGQLKVKVKPKSKAPKAVYAVLRPYHNRHGGRQSWLQTYKLGITGSQGTESSAGG